jgi:predicted nucleic acid-binding protein
VDPTIRAVVDANIILRYLLEDVPAQADAAEAMLEGIHSGETRIWCDPVTLAEVVHALARGYKLEPAHIVKSLWSVVIAPGFLIPSKLLYLRALRLYATSIPHFGDACACAAAMEQTEGRLYSFDKGIPKVEGITRLEQAI